MLSYVEIVMQLNIGQKITSACSSEAERTAWDREAGISKFPSQTIYLAVWLRGLQRMALTHVFPGSNPGAASI